jgi:Cu/Ag efflux protein CusF
MIKKTLALALLCGGATVAFATTAQPGMWDSLVGLKYAKARKEVIDAGWRPDHRKADSAWEQQLQLQYPELRSCTVDRPACTLYFVAYDGTCLKVVAEGEKVNDFTVRSVAKECQRKD